MSHTCPIQLFVFYAHENQQILSEVRLQPHPMHGHELYAGIAFGLFVLMELLYWTYRKMVFMI
jgi:hypothetical protein